MTKTVDEMLDELLQNQKRQNRQNNSSWQQPLNVGMPAPPVLNNGDENSSKNESANSSISGSRSNTQSASKSTQLQAGKGSSTTYLQEPDEAHKKQLQSRLNDIAKANNYAGYDLDNGELQESKTFVSDVVGVNPELMRQRRLDEAERNREKQKSSAFFNALSVLGDMITTAAGGNVYKREADKSGKEAAKRNEQLAREQDAEDKANADKLNKRKNDTLALINKTIDDYNRTYGKHVSENEHISGSIGNTNSSTDSSSKTKTNQRTASATKNNVVIKDDPKDNDRFSGGGDYEIAVIDSDGKLVTNRVPKESAKVLAANAKAIYSEAIAKGDSNLLTILKSKNIVKKDDAGNLTWDSEQLLKSGYLFVNPDGTIQNNASIKDYYQRITGDNRQILSQTPYWSPTTMASDAAEVSTKDLP